MPEPVPFQEALETAERELDRLAGRLDVPVEGRDGPCVVVLGIARQAFEVYRGLRREAMADALGITAPILLRTVADAAILLRWIEDNLPLRVEMYFAEDDRLRLASAVPFRKFRSRRGRDSGPVYPPEREAEMRANLVDVRERARAAGEKIGEHGRMLPKIEAMALATGDTAMWEAYQVIFRIASDWTHLGGSAIASHRVEQRRDGPHLVVKGSFRGVELRAMACPSMAHLIGTVSRICALGIEGEARLWQDAVVEWPTPIE